MRVKLCVVRVGGVDLTNNSGDLAALLLSRRATLSETQKLLLEEQETHRLSVSLRPPCRPPNHPPARSPASLPRFAVHAIRPLLLLSFYYYY